jgi:hypothetical protein
MWASNESDHCIYRHLGLNPIVIKYISPPNAPKLTHGDPRGDLIADPLQYGGRPPGTGDEQRPLAGPGQRERRRCADRPRRVVHRGQLRRPGGGAERSPRGRHQPGFPTAIWTFATTDVPKPACSVCQNYNGQNWSSVIQMLVVPRGAAAVPALLTVESVNNTATLWLYQPAPGQYQFLAPTQISVSSAGWSWHDEQLFGAGPLRGSNGSTLWVRQESDGKLLLLDNIEAGIANPASAAIQVATGFTVSAYPLLTTVGRADSNGDLPLWAVNSSGVLLMIPTTTIAATS